MRMKTVGVLRNGTNKKEWPLHKPTTLVLNRTSGDKLLYKRKDEIRRNCSKIHLISGQSPNDVRAEMSRNSSTTVLRVFWNTNYMLIL